MPVWSDKGNPPGPLNYRQIDELIAFLRATNDQTYVVKRPVARTSRSSTRRPARRRRSPAGATRTTSRRRARRRSRTATSTRSPAAAAAAGAPARLDRPERAGRHGDRAAAARRRPASTRRRSRPRPTRRSPSTFDNQDTDGPHNVVIKDPSGTAVADGRHGVLHRAPKKSQYAVPALKAGDVHVPLPGPPDDDDGHARRSSSRRGPADGTGRQEDDGAAGAPAGNDADARPGPLRAARRERLGLGVAQGRRSGSS